MTPTDGCKFVFCWWWLLITKPLGGFMARVSAASGPGWTGDAASGTHSLRLTGVDESHEMDWKEYALALILFSGVSMILLYVLQRVQQWAWLPWNPQKLAGVPPALAFNTAASLPQIRIGRIIRPSHHELSTQMVGLAYHNWVSAAAGMALAIAFIRGISRREQKTIGFWVDLVRGTL